MKVIVDSSWYLIPACLLAGLTVAVFLYRRGRQDAPRWVNVTVFILRSLSFSVVCLLLAGILIRTIHNETQRPIVVLALDNSRSMVAGKDSDYVKEQLAEDLSAIRARLEDDHEVVTMYFSSDAAESHPASLFGGKETDIDHLFRTVRNNYANQNVGAMVLVTDGIYNKGSNPAFSAAETGFPVHTVGVGDTSERTDVFIRRVDHNQIAYLGNNFPVQVQIGAQRSAGRKVRVELLLNGAVKASTLITIGTDNYSGAVNFTLNASSAGLQNYSARVSDAVREHNQNNNSQKFVVEVLDNREKILLIAAAPHPDIAAIREAISGHTSYELRVSRLQDELPPLQQFNLVILHGYTGEAARVTDLCMQHKVPFWIVNPRSADALPGIRITGGSGRYNEAEPYLDESFAFFQLSSGLRAVLPDLPALTAFFGTYQVPPGSSPLILQRLGSVETAQPLLYFNANGEPRFGVFIGEGLWKWKLRAYAITGNHKVFSELISKSVQYLAARQDKSFFRINGPHVIAENEAADLTAELYNKSYEPVNAPDVTITFTNDQNQKYNYTFSKSGTGYHLSVGSLPPGEYRFRASTSFGGEAFTREGQLAVKETVAEQLNTVADHGLLRQLAARSGGRFFPVQDLPQLQEVLGEGEAMKPVMYSQAITSPLIDQKWIFIILVLLLLCEWFLRKRYMVI